MSEAEVTETVAVTTTEPAGEPEKDWKAEYDKVLAESRKWEGRAKATAPAAKELERLKQESMTELERAVAQARNEAKLEGLREGSTKIAQAEIRAAAAGRPVDVDALLEGVDATRFIGDDGEVDRDAIVGWIDKVAPATVEHTTTTFFDIGQGARGDAVALNGDPIERMFKAKLGIK